MNISNDSAAQNYVERSTPLSVTNQYGVDVSFTTAEMTMSLDLISDRVLKPAMAQLAATIEAECMTRAYRLTNNYTNATTNSLMTYKYFTKGDSQITRQLAPRTDRTTILSVDSKNEFIDATKLPKNVVMYDAATGLPTSDVKITPTTFLVNKRGEIVKQYVGEPDFVAMHQLIDKLLSES
jgi:hypothetical protein